MGELVELLLIEIVEAHPDCVLRSQADNWAEKRRIGDEQHPDAVRRGIQHTCQDRGEQERHQRFDAVRHSIE